MGEDPRPLEAVVNEVVAEAHVRPEELRPEERAYLQEHALKKPLRVLDIWALGVGVVITGEYFGWNLGLRDNGPVAMIVASLIVCLLYLTWVLALSELSVALPFAGGPLAYGRRAVDPSLGFVMGWSMFLECQFATIATALATGGYIAFLVNPADPGPVVAVWAALGTIVLFFLLHTWGVKEQSWVMVVMTYGAILGLVIFWIAAATDFSWKGVWPEQLFDPREPYGGSKSKGWKSVLDAVPYALWWLVIIETVALASEEAHEPHRTIPRGLVWAQLTLIGLVILTWFFACGAMDAQEVAGNVVKDEKGQVVRDEEGKPKRTSVDYPLAKVMQNLPAGKSPLLLYGFGIIALFGMIASYHGMVYGTSRQAFALGRAGYLPAFLGRVHSSRRTPNAALLTCSLIAAGFVIANLWFKDAIAVAVLVSTLTALVWYILAMGCLFVLRKREPHLFATYRAPVYRVLPLTVVLLSAFAIYVYSGIDVKVIPLTALLYALGLGYYWFRAHGQIQKAAPEELAARAASTEAVALTAAPPTPSRFAWLERLTALVLLLVVAALGWVLLAAYLPAWTDWAAAEVRVVFVLVLLGVALLLVSVVALLHTR
ncbi:MAG: amino acid permease [Planctomycetes bacterium]|nr:amino acid permease [Planctomycetota bacterium]